MKYVNVEDYTDDDFKMLAEMRTRLEAHAAPTLVMIDTGPCTDRGPISQYEGSPWMDPDAKWPEDEDGVPMIFAVQVNTRDVSSVIDVPQGVIALFLSEDQPEGKVVFTPEGVGEYRRGNGIPNEPMGIRFVSKVDHPSCNSDAFEVLSADDDGACEGTLLSATIRCAIDDETGEEIPEATAVLSDTIKTRVHNFDGDKVGGHPTWEQADETPDGETFVMQISWNGRINEKAEEVETDVYGIYFVFWNPETKAFSVIFQCD